MCCTMLRRVLGLALATLAVTACGCGPPTFVVTGKVTYNGVALDAPDGMIVFIGPKGEFAAAAIDPDGAYRATKVSQGANQVVAYYPNPKAQKQRNVRQKHGAPPPPKVPLFLTPEKYTAANTSGLSLNVDKDTVFNVDLTDPKTP